MGAIIGAILNYVIMKVVIKENRTILLSVQGTNVWSGANIQSFNSNAVTWGGLSRELYSPSGRYGVCCLVSMGTPVLTMDLTDDTNVYPHWPCRAASVLATSSSFPQSQL